MKRTARTHYLCCRAYATMVIDRVNFQLCAGVDVPLEKYIVV